MAYLLYYISGNYSPEPYRQINPLSSSPLVADLRNSSFLFRVFSVFCGSLLQLELDHFILMKTPNTESKPPKQANVLGVGISAINLESALLVVAQAVDARRKGYVCVTGVHGICEAQSDESFRQILNRAFLCTPDGMPTVWVGRLQGHKTMGRVYGPDLMLDVLALSEQTGYRHFFYGGANGTVEVLRKNLLSRFPCLQIVGTYEPPFRPLNAQEENDLQQQVQAAQPDIMWIGMSTPKQERFMAEYLEKLDTLLMFGVGAAFDFHAGRTRQAPRWMQRSGMEWFFRLCMEPKRLWRRYLKNNPIFLFRIFCQFSGLRKYSIKDS